MNHTQIIYSKQITDTLHNNKEYGVESTITVLWKGIEFSKTIHDIKIFLQNAFGDILSRVTNEQEIQVFTPTKESDVINAILHVELDSGLILRITVALEKKYGYRFTFELWKNTEDLIKYCIVWSTAVV